MSDQQDSGASQDAGEPARVELAKLAAGMPELDFLRLFGDFASATGASLDDPKSRDAFIDRVAAALKAPKPTAIHGLRIEAMFAYVAAAMGECSMITALDSGLFLAETDLRRPDYHVATRTGSRFLVEVKNHSPSKPDASFEMKLSYLASLEKYAERFGCELKMAIYWRALGMWALVDARYFDRVKDRAVLSLDAAMKRNEMAVIGDCGLATAPPLSIRVYTDPEKPRRIGTDGTVEITCARMALCAHGVDIMDPMERRIASFLLLHGTWTRVERPMEVHEGEVLWFDLELAPEQDNEPDSPLPPLVGWLSQMISRKYGEMTVANNAVSLLSPNAEPSALGVVIPHDYRGSVLRLARFYVRPNYDGFAGSAP